MCPAWPLPRPGVAFLLPLGPSLGERGLRGHRRCVPRRPWSPPAGCGCLISCERQRGPRRRPRRWPGRWPPPCPGPRGCWTPAWAWGCCRRWSEVRGPRGSRGEVGEGCGRLSAGLPAVRRGRLVPVPGRRPTVGGRLVPASPGADRPLPLCPPPGGCPPSQATATRSWRAPTSCPAAPCPSVTSSCARVTAPGISVRAQSWRCVNRGGAPPRPTPVQPGPALGTPRGSPASWPRPAQPSPALGTQGRLPAHGATVRRALSQDRAPLSGEALPCFPDSPHGPARLTARRVAAAFDLSRFSAACSLGGCTLALARELAREHPQLHVTELDLHAVGQPPGQEDTQRMRCGTGARLGVPARAGVSRGPCTCVVCACMFLCVHMCVSCVLCELRGVVCSWELSDRGLQRHRVFPTTRGRPPGPSARGQPAPAVHGAAGGVRGRTARRGAGQGRGSLPTRRWPLAGGDPGPGAAAQPGRVPAPAAATRLRGPAGGARRERPGRGPVHPRDPARAAIKEVTRTLGSSL
uniref:Uncharacterized protein n=1 Tax=Oryctolagus cuniculus TaxID=9986 RepID=G1TND2_RABIT